jgi:hypothetical protein
MPTKEAPRPKEQPVGYGGTFDISLSTWFFVSAGDIVIVSPIVHAPGNPAKTCADSRKCAQWIKPLFVR